MVEVDSTQNTTALLLDCCSKGVVREIDEEKKKLQISLLTIRQYRIPLVQVVVEATCPDETKGLIFETYISVGRHVYWQIM